MINLVEKSDTPKHCNAFLDLLCKQGFNNPTVCDFSHLAAATSALYDIFLFIQDELNDIRPISASYLMRNLLYKTPFINSLKYINRCNKTGIPIINYDSIAFHDNPCQDNIIKLTPDESTPTDITSTTCIQHITPLLYYIYNDIGIIHDFKDIFDEEIYSPLTT